MLQRRVELFEQDLCELPGRYVKYMKSDVTKYEWEGTIEDEQKFDINGTTGGVRHMMVRITSKEG